MIYKKDSAIEIQYVALNKTEGLTDVTLKTYNPTGDLVDALVMDEVSNGIYKKSFAPDEVGFWRVTITSVVNEDFAVKTYKITDEDIDSLGGKIDSLEVSVKPGGYIA